ALRYTPAGGRVEVSLAAQEGSAVLTVRDTGVGIPDESLPRIFERFYRVDKARSRRNGGTGLGLAIVKSVAESHGGRVDAVSVVGQGSTFTVQLPLDVGAARPEPTEPPLRSVPKELSAHEVESGSRRARRRARR